MLNFVSLVKLKGSKQIALSLSYSIPNLHILELAKCARNFFLGQQITDTLTSIAFVKK